LLLDDQLFCLPQLFSQELHLNFVLGFIALSFCSLLLDDGTAVLIAGNASGEIFLLLLQF
jgi:hypothetical protein